MTPSQQRFPFVFIDNEKSLGLNKYKFEEEKKSQRSRLFY